MLNRINFKRIEKLSGDGVSISIETEYFLFIFTPFYQQIEAAVLKALNLCME